MINLSEIVEEWHREDKTSFLHTDWPTKTRDLDTIETLGVRWRSVYAAVRLSHYQCAIVPENVFQQYVRGWGFFKIFY